MIVKSENPSITFYKVVLLFGMLFTGMVVSQLLIGISLSLINGIPFYKVSSYISQIPKNSEGRLIYFLIQGFSSLITFGLAPLFFWYYVESRKLSDLKLKISHNSLLSVAFIIFIVIILMPFNALLVEWNNRLALPDFLRGFEAKAMAQEKVLKDLTIFLTNFQNIEELFIGLIVIALIPALVEELMFRGILQNKLSEVFNVHLAILISGILFSAIHLQFYGFFPRMVLGVVFGYLYFWSGNWWMAVWGHFLNNAITLISIYLYNRKGIEFDIESTENIPVSFGLSALSISIILLYYYYKINKTQEVN